MACFTGHIFFHFYVLRHPFGNFLISKFQLNAKIASSHTSCPLSSTSSLSDKEISENIVTENVSKLAEDIFHIHTGSTKPASIATYTGMTITVVLRFLIGITKHFVSF